MKSEDTNHFFRQRTNDEQIDDQINADLFFDKKRIIHKEFVPSEQTVNRVFYKDVIERLRKRVIRVRPDIADKWMLHHDKAPYHTALSIAELLTS